MKKFRIRPLREARGVTQLELARMVGVSKPSVSMWENGVTAPAADKLPVIAAVLGCEVGELYDEDALREASEAARTAVAARAAADAQALAAGK